MNTDTETNVADYPGPVLELSIDIMAEIVALLVVCPRPFRFTGKPGDLVKLNTHLFWQPRRCHLCPSVSICG